MRLLLILINFEWNTQQQTEVPYGIITEMVELNQRRRRKKHAQPISISTTTTVLEKNTILAFSEMPLLLYLSKWIQKWERSLAHFNIVTVNAFRYAETWGHVWKMKSFNHLKCNCLNEFFFGFARAFARLLTAGTQTHTHTIESSMRIRNPNVWYFKLVASCKCVVLFTRHDVVTVANGGFYITI